MITEGGTYRGVVTAVTGLNGSYGYLGSTTIRSADEESDACCQCEHDIFVHVDDCDEIQALEPGLEVRFIANPDRRRGEGYFRAGWARETSESKLRRLAKGGITLNLQGYDGSRVLQSPNCFATWCISPQVAQKVKEWIIGEKKAARLLLVQKYKKAGIEERQLVRLDDKLAHLTFKDKGVCRVYALIVFAGNEDYLYDKYLKKLSGNYATDVISNDGCSFLVLHVGSAYLEAEVPKGLLAERPRDWEWVNFLFKEDSQEECITRRRRTVAYTVQIPLVLLMMLARLALVLLLVAGGKRGIRYDALNTLRFPFDAIWDKSQGSVFVRQFLGRPFDLTFMASPYALGFYALMGYLLSLLTGHTWWMLWGLFVSLAWLCGGAKALAVWLETRTRAAGWSMQWRERCVARKLERERIKTNTEYAAKIARQQQLEAEVSELICTATGPKEVDVHQLPFTPRTIRFRFQALKDRVCRPYVSS